MEAIEFLKEYNRMCTVNKYCHGCPLTGTTCSIAAELSEEQIINIVDKTERWSKEHPIITNAQKFEEVFGQKHSFSLMFGRFREGTPEPIFLESDWWYEPYKEPEHDD